MVLRQTFLFCISMAAALTGCAVSHLDTGWPERRPSGRDLSTYQAPRVPPGSDARHPKLDEPTGDITLRQALTHALMKNPELAAFAWEVRAGEARTLQAGLFPNPELEVETEGFGGDAKGFDVAETTIQLSQLIELGGKRSARTKVAALERNLAGWDYESKRLDVFTETTVAFIELLAAQKQLALNADLAGLAEKFFDTVAAQVKAGKVSPVEEIKAQVVLSLARIEEEKAKRDLEAARNQLASMWGSTSVAFQAAKGELDAISRIPALDVLLTRLLKNPDLARWETELRQRRASLELEKAGRYPDVKLGFGFKHANETDEKSFVLGASFPLPLFDKNQGGILEARQNIAKAQAERLSERVRITTALSSAYQTLAKAYSEATNLKKNILPLAKSAYEASRTGYAEGKFEYLEVLDSQQTLFDAKGQYIEALAAYHQAVAEVERLIAEPLEAAGRASDSGDKEVEEKGESR